MHLIFIYIHGHAHRCKQVYHAGAQGSFLHWALMWPSWQDSQSIAVAMTRWVVFKKFSIVFSLFLMVSHGLFWGIPDSWHENKIERLVTRHREYRDQSRSVGSVHISHDMQRQCSSCRLEVRSILLRGFDQDRVQTGWRFTGCKICKWI